MNIWIKTALIGLILVTVTVSADWLKYDNNNPWGQILQTGQGDGYGVKFTPGDTGVIMKMKAYIGVHTEGWNVFKVWLYGWNTTYEQPSDDPIGDPNPLGELIGSGDDGWFTLDFDDQTWDSGDPFVIALTNKFGEPEVDTIYKASNDYGGGDLYWMLVNDEWDTYTPNKHLMVQVFFSGTPVESTSLGSIKAVFK